MNKLRKNLLILPFCLVSLGHAQTVDLAYAYSPQAANSFGGQKKINAQINSRFRESREAYKWILTRKKRDISLKVKFRTPWRRSGSHGPTLRQLATGKGLTVSLMRQYRTNQGTDILTMITTGKSNLMKARRNGYAAMSVRGLSKRRPKERFAIAMSTGAVMGAGSKKTIGVCSRYTNKKKPGFSTVFAGSCNISRRVPRFSGYRSDYKGHSLRVNRKTGNATEIIRNIGTVSRITR